MPTQWETFPIQLTGGLITSMGRLEQGINFPGSATKLENFEEDVLGGYSRVMGHRKFSQEAVPGAGQIKAAIPVSRTSVIAYRGDEWSLSSGGAWSTILSSRSGNLVTKTHHDYFNFDGNNKFVIVDGVGTPMFFNTTTNLMEVDTTAPDDVVGAKWVRVFKSHVFFGKGNNLIFTAPYNEKDYTPASGGGIVNVGDTITGLIVFREQLIVFCLNKIFRLSGNTEADFVLSEITTNSGCLCGYTVQEVGGDIMYLGPDGIRYLSASERDNDFGLTRASAKIQADIMSVVSNNCLYSSVTISEKNQYRFFYNTPSSNRDYTKNFIAVKFSNQTSDNISWSNLVGVKLYSIAKLQERDFEFIVFCDEGPHIQIMESGYDFDGRTIKAVFESPFFPINDPKIRKTFYKHTVYTSLGGSVNLYGQLLFDYERNDIIQPQPFPIIAQAVSTAYNSGQNYNEGHTYGGLNNRVEFYNNVQGSGFVTAIRYSSNELSSDFNLNFSVLEYRTNERK